MAGILFTNEKLFLAGYKSFKGHITGIGGKQKQGESLYRTAVRETLEELLGIVDISESELQLFEVIKPYNTLKNHGYTHFCCSFVDLTLFLRFAYMIRKVTPFYDLFPYTLEELLLERKNSESSEISHLALLPFVKDVRVANHLVEDINLYETPVSMK